MKTPSDPAELDGLPGQVYGHVARMGHALSDPSRLRALNLLAQTERGVDDLARRLGQSAANTSAHLKVLERARLVARRKSGRRVYYRLASPAALRLFLAIRDMALDEVPAVREAMQRNAHEPALRDDLWGEALTTRAAAGDVQLVDLRPTEEYATGHLPHARSLPFDEIETRAGALSAESPVFAYCRGPFCLAAIRGTAALRAAGLDAWRLPGGVAEWQAEGRPLVRARPAAAPR